MPAFLTRVATQDDLVAMAQVRVETWRFAYRDIIPAEFLQNLSIQTTVDRWQKFFWEDRQPGVELFVAENGQGRVVGFAVCGPERTGDPLYPAELYALYVQPAVHKMGVGRRLFYDGVTHLVHSLGADSLLLWALAENPYRKFYERLGGIVVRERSIDIGGCLYPEVGYGWNDLGLLSLG